MSSIPCTPAALPTTVDPVPSLTLSLTREHPHGINNNGRASSKTDKTCDKTSNKTCAKTSVLATITARRDIPVELLENSRPPVSLTLAIDRSGSMAGAAKLGLVKSTAEWVIRQMSARDAVGQGRNSVHFSQLHFIRVSRIH